VLFAGMQRDGYEQVHRSETFALPKVFPHETAQLQAQLAIMLVLDPVQHVLNHAMGGEKEERTRGFELHFTSEKDLHPVIRVIMEPGAGQVSLTKGTQAVLEVPQPLPTTTTSPWKE